MLLNSVFQVCLLLYDTINVNSYRCQDYTWSSSVSLTWHYLILPLYPPVTFIYYNMLGLTRTYDMAVKNVLHSHWRCSKNKKCSYYDGFALNSFLWGLSTLLEEENEYWVCGTINDQVVLDLRQCKKKSARTFHLLLLFIWVTTHCLWKIFYSILKVTESDFYSWKIANVPGGVHTSQIW